MKTSILINYIIIFIAWIEMLCFSGVIYGINSLFPVLKIEKLFLEYCNSTNSSGIANEGCSQQNKMFGYILVTAVASQCLIAFPIGVFFDKYGRSWTKIVAGTSYLLGCLFFYFFTNSSLLIYPFAIFLGLTTQSLLNCNLSLANLFPKYQHRIVSLLSGSLDSSSFMFTFISLSYFAGVSLFTSILMLGICGFTLMIFSSLCLRRDISCTNEKSVNKRSIAIPHTDSDDNEEKGDEIGFEEQNNNGNVSNKMDKEIKIHNSKSENERIFCDKMQVNTMKRYPTLLTALFSRQYWLQMIYFTIVFFRFTFSLAQLSLQIGHHFPAQESKINGLLYISSFFFVCGVLVSPFAGLIVDCFKNKLVRSCDRSQSGAVLYDATLKCFVLPIFICCTSNLLLSILIMVPKVWAVYLTYCLITITRAFLFSLNSSYMLQAFPAKYFGKLFGGVTLFSGLVSFIQYALLFRNPQHMKNVNFVLIAVSCLSFGHPFILWFWKGREKTVVTKMCVDC